MKMKGMSGALSTMVCQKCAMWMFVDEAFVHDVKLCPFCKDKNIKVKNG